MIFLIALGLSFIGSLPFGMINMAVANAAIHRGVAAGVMLGLGAAIIEFFQVLLALKFTWLFAEGGMLGHALQVVGMAVFLAAGCYFFFFAKTQPPVVGRRVPGKRRRAVVKGMGISVLNLMVIPYWIFYGTLLTEHGLLERENVQVVIFAAGATVGAFALLVCYAFLGAKILSKSEAVTRSVNKFIGVVLVGFGLFQAYKLWVVGC